MIDVLIIIGIVSLAVAISVTLSFGVGYLDTRLLPYRTGRPIQKCIYFSVISLSLLVAFLANVFSWMLIASIGMGVLAEMGIIEWSLAATDQAADADKQYLVRHITVFSTGFSIITVAEAAQASRRFYLAKNKLPQTPE